MRNDKAYSKTSNRKYITLIIDLKNIAIVKLLRYLFWILRGSGTDIVNIYNSVTPVIELANGGKTLNRGYWNNNAKNPLQAQYQLCKLVGEFADFRSAHTLLDVGSGNSVPAIYWKSIYELLNITCLDINFDGLKTAAGRNKDLSKIPSSNIGNRISHINASGTSLPFSNNSIDRIVTVEASHHFKPLELFVRECNRVLEEKGLLTIVTPVKTITQGLTNLTKFGILSLFMPSNNYFLSNLKSIITRNGFQIIDILFLGPQVYEPVTNYYIENREILRHKILSEYPSYVETILYKSLLKTRDAYKKGVLEYVLIKCSQT